MIVPEVCLPLLREQRTHMKDPSEYGAELARTFEGFRAYLPRRAERIMDIGCGMAGIDVLMHRHYPDAEIVLVDKHGVSDVIRSGFADHRDEMSHYHDFGQALALLEANGVDLPRVTTHDVTDQDLPDGVFDVVISLLSWGFHYPIQDYAPSVRPGGVIIADCRRGTGGDKVLSKRGAVRVVHSSAKYDRVVCQC